MTAQGHIVGNHTFSHPDMSGISSLDTFREELVKVEDLYREVTGEEMPRYYRPPRGIYSTENLSMAKELGYHTFFWSLAYVDWLQEEQPTHEEAFEKLLGRIHPGAIVLLHNTSRTNGEILDELLTRWEENWAIRSGSPEGILPENKSRTAPSPAAGKKFFYALTKALWERIIRISLLFGCQLNCNLYFQEEV